MLDLLLFALLQISSFNFTGNTQIQNTTTSQSTSAADHGTSGWGEGHFDADHGTSGWGEGH